MSTPMLASTASQPSSSQECVDRAIVELKQGASRLAASSLEQRIDWAMSCIDGVASVADQWVEAACRAKQIPDDSPARAEEILVGPVSVVRFLRLMIRTFRDLQTCGMPRLPGQPRQVRDQLRVPVFATNELYDSLVFQPLAAHTWLQPGVTSDRIFGNIPARLSRQVRPEVELALVLGAGNVSAIPATDALTKILQDDCVVLLKMNPVNDYLGPLFERALEPLMKAGLLRIVYGGADVGRHAVNHPQVDTVHVTGSIDTHDAIVWGPDLPQRRQRQAAREPLLRKPVSSELGNVTPWAIVPGKYSERQLLSQAENVAASITNNASFNCIATKLLITWKRWPAREHFLDLVASILAKVPPRYGYYPGAYDRFAEFANSSTGPDDQGRLPWVLRRGVDPEQEPHLFERESFVCVAAETALDAASPEEFLERAVRFMNERTWGTLAAALTVPNALQRQGATRLDAALQQLRFGTIGVNQWPGVAYALMSPPWGAFPGAELSDVQSGLGFVHNTFLLEKPQKTVLTSPLSLFPKPVWFSTHKRPEAVAWRLHALYCQPSWWKIPPLLSHALRG